MEKHTITITVPSINVKGGFGKMKGVQQESYFKVVSPVKNIPSKMAHAKRASAYVDTMDSKKKTEVFLSLDNEAQAKVMNKASFYINKEED